MSEDINESEFGDKKDTITFLSPNGEVDFSVDFKEGTINVLRKSAEEQGIELEELILNALRNFVEHAEATKA